MNAEGRLVTVAVVSWNTRDLLDRCLASLQPNWESGMASVIVVDNGSTDGSGELVRSDHPWVELIEPEENLGFGRGVNLAARRSESTWLVAANADVEVTPGAIEALIEAAEANPGAGPIAPRLILPDGSTQHSVHRFPSPSLSLFFGLGVQRLSPRLGDRLCLEGYWDADRPRRVDWAFGAFLLVRREHFEAVGGFDEQQWMYAEDIDLAWRLTEAGHPSRYEPAARVLHAESASARKAFTDFDRDRRHLAASYVWLARRRGSAVARLTGWINLAGAGGRFLVLSALAPVVPRLREPRDQARRYLALHRAAMRTTPSQSELPREQ